MTKQANEIDGFQSICKELANVRCRKCVGRLGNLVAIDPHQTEMSFEEYLESEHTASTKREFVDPTLGEYVIIDSTRVLVEIFRRSADGWGLQEHGPGSAFRLESIPLEVKVDDLYEDIERGPLEQGVIDTKRYPRR